LIKLFDPVIDLKERKAIVKVLEGKFWASGSGSGLVSKFENEFKKYIKSDACIGVNSGTAALNLALSLFDVKNKEVILPSLSFVSTAHCVVENGGTPIFVDIEPDTLCIDPKKIKPMKIVTNSGNGCAGPILDMLEDKLPIEFIKIQNEPDGSFPNGIPNPLLPENREITSKAVIEHSADLGIAWDGDFDRCFFFNSNGEFIESYYLIALLGEQLLKQSPGESIVHDPRLVWNTVEEVDGFGGTPVISKSGHSFIKEAMRENNSVYGGEMSGHHYFRDFYYSDSGMIPWLLLIENASVSGSTLTDLVKNMISKFPVSGEINRTVSEPEKLLEKIKDHYLSFDPIIDNLDGYSFDFGSWRFNLRMSNTEPLVRLNVESRNDAHLMQTKTEEVLELIEKLG